MTTEELLESVRENDVERLRWQLCRLFGVAPWSKLGRSLGEEDCLALAAQMVLDGETGSSPRTENPRFDDSVFRQRKDAADVASAASTEDRDDSSESTHGQAGGETPPLPAESAGLADELEIRDSGAPVSVTAEITQRPGVTVTYDTGGKAVTLRREPGVSPADKSAERETRRGEDGPEEGQKMRDISRYFCRDSRRYDPGFTRY